MPSSGADYAPFASVVGYAGAIMAAAAALFLLWGGKMRMWRPPDEDLPGTAQKFVVLLCGVGMVVQWYLAVPETIGWFLGIVVALGLASILCFFRYVSLLGVHIYYRKVATGRRSTTHVRVLGGRRLLPDAEAKRAELRIDTQALFEGAAYNTDLLWSREERQWVKQRVLLFFILSLVFGTSALTGAGLATQIILTKTSARVVTPNADGGTPRSERERASETRESPSAVKGTRSYPPPPRANTSN